MSDCSSFLFLVLLFILLWSPLLYGDESLSALYIIRHTGSGYQLIDPANGESRLLPFRNKILAASLTITEANSEPLCYFIIVDYQFSLPLNKLNYNMPPFFLADTFSPLILVSLNLSTMKVRYLQRIELSEKFSSASAFVLSLEKSGRPLVFVGDPATGAWAHHGSSGSRYHFLGRDIFFGCRATATQRGEKVVILSQNWVSNQLKAIGGNIRDFSARWTRNNELLCAYIAEKQRGFHWFTWDEEAQFVSGYFHTFKKVHLQRVSFDSTGRLWVVEVTKKRQSLAAEPPERVSAGKNEYSRFRQFYRIHYRLHGISLGSSQVKSQLKEWVSPLLEEGIIQKYRLVGHDKVLIQEWNSSLTRDGEENSLSDGLFLLVR